ncbi:hypothetical protein ANCCAN_30009 [Ancylostoma caninum]|uniref:Uncharacterized protein n=1 Tax=Ancylostoma caninum TaxID=29170 RepID=A0A368EY74_ANCCA|nr:hypothetical protein ANCCAN_30009 [Ancylostoma caninum]
MISFSSWEDIIERSDDVLMKFYGLNRSLQGGADVPNGAPASGGSEVPGFGTNSSIHELFGKMVWKKMEGLRDESVIDRLQNRIMNMIHEALAEQSSGTGGNQGNGTNGRQVGGGGFRSF